MAASTLVAGIAPARAASVTQTIDVTVAPIVVLRVDSNGATATSNSGVSLIATADGGRVLLRTHELSPAHRASGATYTLSVSV